MQLIQHYYPGSYIAVLYIKDQIPSQTWGNMWLYKAITLFLALGDVEMEIHEYATVQQKNQLESKVCGQLPDFNCVFNEM